MEAGPRQPASETLSGLTGCRPWVIDLEEHPLHVMMQQQEMKQ